MDNRAALVERVAMVIEQAENERVPDGFYTGSDLATSAWSAYLATAAIDLIRAEVLEEAAKAADSYHRIVETKRDLFEDGNITVTKGYTLADPRKIAAAIRALKEK